MSAPLMPFLVVLLLGCIATVWDMRRRVVPNRVNLAGAVAGLILGAARGGVEGVLLSALGLVVATLAFAGPWLVGGLGGGDLKLAAALCAIAGWPLAFPVLLAGGVAMAVWSLGWLAIVRLRGGSDGAPLRGLRVPQAPALAAGAVAVMAVAILR